MQSYLVSYNTCHIVGVLLSLAGGRSNVLNQHFRQKYLLNVVSMLSVMVKLISCELLMCSDM
jgi:hypothetical protein